MTRIYRSCLIDTYLYDRAIPIVIIVVVVVAAQGRRWTRVVTTGRFFSRRLFGFQRQREHCSVGTFTMASPTDRVFFVNFLIDGPSLSESTLVGR